jgi:hypothetical protein
MRIHKPFVFGWFGLTTVLTLFIIVHPSITGIQELRAHDGEEPDLLVQLEGRRVRLGGQVPGAGRAELQWGRLAHRPGRPFQGHFV